MVEGGEDPPLSDPNKVNLVDRVSIKVSDKGSERSVVWWLGSARERSCGDVRCESEIFLSLVCNFCSFQIVQSRPSE